MNIIVYGMGENGKHLKERISVYYQDKVTVYGTADRKFQSKIENNIDLYQRNLPVVIAIGSRKNVKEAYDMLSQMGFNDVYMYLKKDSPPYTRDDNFLENECIKINNENEDLIPHVEIHAADCCNLNCKGCVHFSPLFSKENEDPYSRLRDIDLVAGLSRNILSFYILGGEPLLNPCLDVYVKKAREFFETSDIQIVTNGLKLMTCPGSLLDIVRECNVLISISEYQPTRKISSKIRNRLEKHGVAYSFRYYDSKEKFIKPLCKDINGVHEYRCISDGCVSVCDGRIARCPTLMYVNKLNDTFNVSFPTEGIYDLDYFNSASEINDKMNMKVPLCKYCVDVEINWERCDKGMPKLSDFVSE